MKKIFKILFLILNLIWLATLSQAAQEEPIKKYTSPRSVAMGGINTTTGNYAEALFANPARHAEVNTWKIIILELTTETNLNLLKDSGEISKISSSSGSGTLSSTTNLMGNNQHGRFQLLSGYFNPNFLGEIGIAFGYLASAQASVNINYTTDIANQIYLTTGPVLGVSRKFLNKTLSVGMNLHLLYRIASEGNIYSLSFLNGAKFSLQNFGKQGLGADADLGVYYRIPLPLRFMRIRTGGSLNNLMKNHYNAAFSLVRGVGNRPVNDDRVGNLGVRVDFADFHFLTAPLIALEMHQIGDTSKRFSVFKRFHLGGETRVYQHFLFRLGLNQGYLSAGVGFDLPVFKFDLATYGEELTGVAGGSEDRRFIARLAFEI